MNIVKNNKKMKEIKIDLYNIIELKIPFLYISFLCSMKAKENNSIIIIIT